MIDLYEIIIQHERFLSLRATTNHHSTITNALAATTTETQSRPRCSWSQCKKIGHTEDKCWIKNPKLKKQRLPPTTTKIVEKANAVTAAQFQHYSLMTTTVLQDLLHRTCSDTAKWYDTPTCPSEISHQEFSDLFNTEEEMANVVVEAGKHAVLQVSTSKSKENTAVVMDSACTAHMMCNEKYFDAKSIIYYKKGDKQTPQIKVTNSTIINATGIGYITIPTTNTKGQSVKLQLQNVFSLFTF